MSVLVTMRVKVKDFENVKAATAKYRGTMKRLGCHWSRVYRAEKDPNDVLFVQEWDSHDAFNAASDEFGEDFNTILQPAGEWDDVVWHLSNAAQIE